jgi:hypothetical protein
VPRKKAATANTNYKPPSRMLSAKDAYSEVEEFADETVKAMEEWNETTSKPSGDIHLFSLFHAARYVMEALRSHAFLKKTQIIKKEQKNNA